VERVADSQGPPDERPDRSGWDAGGPTPRHRLLAAVLIAFDLADGGQDRAQVADYLRSTGLDDEVLEPVVALAFHDARGR
jgi:hypothetical protein